jgi:hypothetical protein
LIRIFWISEPIFGHAGNGIAFTATDGAKSARLDKMILLNHYRLCILIPGQQDMVLLPHPWLAT